MSSGSEQYEVEAILGHKYVFEGAVVLYQIKWRGYGEDEATWEPEDNLECGELVNDYWAAVKTARGCSSAADKLHTERWFETTYAAALRDMGITLKAVEQHDGADMVVSLKLEPRVLLADRVARLKDFGAQIGAECARVGAPVVSVENELDLEGPPEPFTFGCERRQAADGGDDENVLSTACSCAAGGCGASADCSCRRAIEKAFDAGAVTRGRFGAAVSLSQLYSFECGDDCTCGEQCANRATRRGRCVCGEQCANRATQRPRQARHGIFRSADKGWAVRTLERIPAQSFVLEYVAEVISALDAVERLNRYKTSICPVLFPLGSADPSEELPEYFLDATEYGNEARFLNHSCAPNLQLRFVWANGVRLDQPRVCFFAERDIEAGEELCYDYQLPASYTSAQTKAMENRGERIVRCRCGAARCANVFWCSRQLEQQRRADGSVNEDNFERDSSASSAR